MSTWYRLKPYSTNPEFEKVDVLKETDKFITLIRWGKESRTAKGNEYFPTFADLKAYLLDSKRRQLDAAERNLAYSKKQLALAEELEDK